MIDDKIKNLLQKADHSAPGTALDSSHLASAVRHRAERRRTVNFVSSAAAAALILIVLGVFYFINGTAETKQRPDKVASLQAEVKELQARADATLKLLREVLEYERRQDRLNELQAQLAAIPDPLEEIREQVDKTAFILVYQADRMYRELNQKDSAVRTYKRVIELFPETQWAEVAGRRLSEIQTNKANKNNIKI